MVAAAILALLLIAVYVVLRTTSLSAVEDVTVVGVEGPNAREARHALEQASVGQSTLGFDAAALREAVVDMPSITGVDVHTRFPHGVQIEVHQRVAVGALSVDGRKIAVATDGTLLPEWDAGDLPIVNGGRATGGRLVAEHRAAARILAGAPDALRAKTARIDKTTIVRLADGPALLFHDASRVAAKWMAATAVLADSSSVGATWIDLRVPERPVAGSGAPPVTPSANERARDLRPGGMNAATETTTPTGATAVTPGTGTATSADATGSGVATPATGVETTPEGVGTATPSGAGTTSATAQE